MGGRSIDVLSNTYAANIFAAGLSQGLSIGVGCIVSSTFLPLLSTIFTTARDRHLLIGLIEPVQSSFHLLAKNGEDIKDELITVS